MNSVNIIGRLGRDPELRYTPAGKSVCELNLAVDYGYGENKKTAWLGVVLWEKTAEIAAQHLRKGDQCGISGFLCQDTWDDKETGKKQTKTKITAERLHFTGGKKEDQSERPAAQERTSAPNPAAQQNDEDDEIPF
jgi:single-strand DNA-binding protein